MTDDDFSDTFYYRAIRTKIGEALRDRLVPKEPLPERLLDLVQQVERPRGDDIRGTEDQQQSVEKSETNKFEE